MLPLLRCFFAHLLILQYPDHHQNLISSYLYYSGPVHKISSQSVHNFLSFVVHRQTDRQTDRQTNATKKITSFAKEVTRSTQRAQTSLAEADHYSNMPTVKMLSLGGERLPLTPQKNKQKKGFGSLPAPQSGYSTAIIVFSIVTTFKGADIKVEVANFCAAMDTLINQDGW